MISYRSLQKLDSELLDHLKVDVAGAIEGAQNAQMKEIRGLGERLSGLELLLLEAKRLVQEQQKLAAAFVQNQQRASGLRDNSILPDLCASHRQQLNVMKDNHQQIISICNRTAKAKNELSDNLHKRMKWVVFIQVCTVLKFQEFTLTTFFLQNSVRLSYLLITTLKRCFHGIFSK